MTLSRRQRTLLQTQPYYSPAGISGRTRRATGVRRPAIPDNLILLPEENDLDSFSGNTDDWGITNGDKSREFENVFRYVGSGDSDIFSDSGLDNYPEVGEKQSFWFYPESEDFGVHIGWGRDDDIPNGSGYRLTLHDDDNNFAVQRDDDGSGTAIDSESFDFDSEKWYQVETLHEPNGDIDVLLLDDSGATLESLSGNDDTYISNGEYDFDGISFRSFIDVGWWLEVWKND